MRLIQIIKQEDRLIDEGVNGARLFVLKTIPQIDHFFDNAAKLVKINNIKLARRCYARAVELYQGLYEVFVQNKTDPWFDRVYERYKPRFERKKKMTHREVSPVYRAVSRLLGLNRNLGVTA